MESLALSEFILCVLSLRAFYIPSMYMYPLFVQPHNLQCANNFKYTQKIKIQKKDISTWPPVLLEFNRWSVWQKWRTTLKRGLKPAEFLGVKSDVSIQQNRWHIMMPLMILWTTKDWGAHPLLAPSVFTLTCPCALEGAEELAPDGP